MKTTPIDFLLSGLALALLLAGALALTGFLVAPLTAVWVGDYRAIANGLVFLLAFGLLSALLSRVLLALRPFQAGAYSMDDPLFIRWKLLTVIYEFGRGALLPFTTVFARPLVATLFGARIGANTALGGRIADPFLVTVGEGAVLGHNSVLTPHAITTGRLILKEVRIGRGVTVGVNTVVMAGAEIGDGSVLAAGSVVPPFTRIPPGELWGGVPARRIKALEDSDYRA